MDNIPLALLIEGIVLVPFTAVFGIMFRGMKTQMRVTESEIESLTRILKTTRESHIYDVERLESRIKKNEEDLEDCIEARDKFEKQLASHKRELRKYVNGGSSE